MYLFAIDIFYLIIVISMNNKPNIIIDINIIHSNLRFCCYQD